MKKTILALCLLSLIPFSLFAGSTKHHHRWQGDAYTTTLDEEDMLKSNLEWDSDGSPPLAMSDAIEKVRKEMDQMCPADEWYLDGVDLLCFAREHDERKRRWLYYVWVANGQSSEIDINGRAVEQKDRLPFLVYMSGHLIRPSKRPPTKPSTATE